MISAVGETVYATELIRRLPTVSGFDTTAITGGGASAALGYPISSLTSIQPESLRQEVLQQYALSIQAIWKVVTPFAGVALLCTFFLKVYSLDRKTTRLGADGEKPAENAGKSSDATRTEAAPNGDLERGATKEAVREEADTGIDARGRTGAMGAGEATEGAAPL